MTRIWGHLCRAVGIFFRQCLCHSRKIFGLKIFIKSRSHKKWQLIKFKEIIVNLLCQDTWSQNSDTRNVKEAFETRAGYINTLFKEWWEHADKPDDTKLNLEFNAVCRLLLDMLAYLEIYLVKWEYNIHNDTSSTFFSEAAREWLKWTSSKYEYYASDLHKQVLEALDSGGVEPPTESIIKYADYIAWRVGQIEWKDAWTNQ